jgi:uncharacterized protein (DUF697 family)
MIFDDFLLKHKKAQESESVHLVWYALSGAGKRFTDLDVKLIKRIKSEGYPVCVLLTKIDELDEIQLSDMMSSLAKELVGVEVFRLSAMAKQNAALVSFCDWEKLINWSYEKLPRVFKDRFVAALRGGLELKRKQALAVIGGAITGAGAVCLSPIPFSDAFAIIPIQTGMIVGIAAIYNIHVGKAAIGTLTSSATVSAFGKALAGNIIKCIPGGTAVGIAINASVAGVITGALGGAFSELCYKQCKDTLDGKPVTIDIEAILTAPSFIAEVMEKAEMMKKEKENKI